jgi:hypothetical protein
MTVEALMCVAMQAQLPHHHAVTHRWLRGGNSEVLHLQQCTARLMLWMGSK